MAKNPPPKPRPPESGFALLTNTLSPFNTKDLPVNASPHEVVSLGVLIVVLATAAVCDLRTDKIPNWLTLTAVLLGLIWAGIAGYCQLGFETFGQGMGSSGLGLLAGFLPMAIMFFVGGMGGGDVKLCAGFGAICANWECALGCLVYSFALAFVMAIIIMCRHRIMGRTLMRILSTVMTLSAKVKPNMPTDSPRVPFGVAVAGGGLIAGIEFLLHVPMPWS
ncbi:MAG: prepilin peptidase [Phycisphaeraceae bacterium]|nr:prepilin peptidase [Phycisphaeraceae bacterium]